jgi:cysteine synthase A
VLKDVSQSIGHSPLVELARFAPSSPSRIVAKLDMHNPGGSVKDRLGLALITDAERTGALRPGGTIIEATGGNTGIGLAMIAAVRGYRIILTMPEAMSAERVALLEFLGAEVHLTPGILMEAAVSRAKELAIQIPGAVLMDQFNNPANPQLHRTTTAIEILRDIDAPIDVFVAAVGTGGTITGVGAALKDKDLETQIVAVEPDGAAVLSGRAPSKHQMPGIGVGFVPKVLDLDLLDRVVPVSDGDAFSASRRLARTEGIMAGVSAGAALHAAAQEASDTTRPGRTIVVFLADTAERYLSSALFAGHTHPAGG